MSRLAAALLLAVLLAACGSESSPSATDDVTATTSATTTAPQNTTPATAPGVCPAASVPAGATDVTTAAGDFDGDGRPDQVRTYRHTGDYHVQIGLAAGGGDTLVVNPEFQAGLLAIGGFDVDGDDDDEIWLSVSSGGPVRVVGLFAFGACTLAEVSLDGVPARFTINRTFLGGGGVECSTAAAGGLSVLGASSDDGANFLILRRTLKLDGAVLSEVSKDTSNETAVTVLLSFNCGSLTF